MLTLAQLLVLALAASPPPPLLPRTTPRASPTCFNVGHTSAGGVSYRSEKETVPEVHGTGGCRRPPGFRRGQAVSPSSARGLLPSASSRHSKQRPWRHPRHRLILWVTGRHNKVHKHAQTTLCFINGVYWHFISCVHTNTLTLKLQI